MKGTGNSINYKYRVHDPRVGRFLSIDPLTKKYPFYSPYAFSGNRVIDAVELEGMECSKDLISYDDNFKWGTESDLSEEQRDYMRKEVGKVGFFPLAGLGGAFLWEFGLGAELTMLSETSWSSLPLFQSFAEGAGSLTLKSGLIGGGLDAFGQIGSNMLTTNFDLGASVRRWNMTSSFMTALNPSNGVFNLALNGIISNTFQAYPTGEMKLGSGTDIIAGSFAEVGFGAGFGKAGDGLIQKYFNFDDQISNLYKIHFDSYITPSNSNILYNWGTDAFSDMMDESFDNILKLEIKNNITNFSIKNSISLGGQTLKNSTLKLNSTVDD